MVFGKSCTEIDVTLFCRLVWIKFKPPKTGGGIKTGKDMWHLKQLTGSISPFNSSIGVSNVPWLQVFSNNFVEIHLTFMKHIFYTLHKNKNSLYCVSWLARIEAWGKQQTDFTKNVISPQHQYKSMRNEPDKKS